MRASPILIALACGLAAASVRPAAAETAGKQLAQSGPPVRLTPRNPSGGSTGRPPVERRGGIREERLGRINPESTGVLDDANGGLGGRLWSGTPRATVVALIGRMPSRYRSAALRDLHDRQSAAI